MEGVPRFCARCGGRLVAAATATGAWPRLLCAACRLIAYRNPAVGVAVVLTDGDRVLLGRRARGRYAGQWCIPCGYVEWDEDIRDAACREMAEETGLIVQIGDVCAVHSNFHDPAKQTVGVWFWGTITGGMLAPGDDLDQVEYHPIASPPRLAFPTDSLVLATLRDRVRT
jgi:ADP-ribose pyrophosphatase YjhB (NUDIX family)